MFKEMLPNSFLYVHICRCLMVEAEKKLNQRFGLNFNQKQINYKPLVQPFYIEKAFQIVKGYKVNNKNCCSLFPSI